MEQSHTSTTDHTLPPLPPEPVDVAIIGGGLAGLTAAATAARCGASTFLIEAKGLGGRARTDDRNGVRLNLGPHALYRKGVGAQVLADLDVEVRGGVPTAAGPGFAAGRQGELPLGARTAATTKLLSAGSKLKLAAFMARLGKIDTAAINDITIAEYLRTVTDRSDLLEFLHGVVRLATYANAPDHMSAGAVIEQLVMANNGVLYLDHGWAALIDSLRSVAERHGARVITATPATSITPESGRWLVTTPRGSISASTVVLAGLAPEAVERVAGLDDGSLRAIAGPAARAACLDLVLDAVPEHGFSLDLEHAMYYSVHTTVADLAPEGVTLASLAHYRLVGEDGEVNADRAMLQDYARRLGIVSVRDERYLHDMVVTNGVPLASRGGMTGRPTVDQLAGDRFGRRGVFLAGDWVGAEGMLADAALASGARAGRDAAHLVASVVQPA